MVSNFKNKIKQNEYLDIDNSSVLPDYLSNKDYMCLLNDFFSGTDKEIYQLFLKIYKESEKNIFFTKNSENEIMGTTFFVPYLNKCYIKQLYNEFYPLEDDILTGTHEFGHAISSLLNPKRYYIDNILREIEALFFELISVDFFDKTFKGNMFSNVSYENLFSYHDDSIQAKKLLDSYNKYISLINNGLLIQDLNIKKQEKFKLGILDDFGMTKSLISDMKSEKKLFDSIEYYNLFNYLISYIVAINLYLIYQNDKEKALYLLKEIVKSNDIEEYVLINSFIDKDAPVLFKEKIENNLKMR